MEFIISPSLPAKNYDEINGLLSALQDVAPAIQIDIVDGQFVPLTAWPFTEPEPTMALRQLAKWSSSFSLGIDCMVMEPQQYVDTIAAIGAQRIIFHWGSTEAYDEAITAAQAAGLQVALALTNEVALSVLDPYLDRLDFVQLMGIKAVGQQGQPFDERTLTRARTLRERYPQLDIGVDGAVNARTIIALRDAGVNRFAPGSAIAATTEPATAYKQLVDLVYS